jgi:hypothetical protein
MEQSSRDPQKQLSEECYFIELGLEGCPKILPRGEATQPQLFPATFP